MASLRAPGAFLGLLLLIQAPAAPGAVATIAEGTFERSYSLAPVNTNCGLGSDCVFEASGSGEWFGTLKKFGDETYVTTYSGSASERLHVRYAVSSASFCAGLSNPSLALRSVSWTQASSWTFRAGDDAWAGVFGNDAIRNGEINLGIPIAYEGTRKTTFVDTYCDGRSEATSVTGPVDVPFQGAPISSLAPAVPGRPTHFERRTSDARVDVRLTNIGDQEVLVTWSEELTADVDPVPELEGIERSQVIQRMSPDGRSGNNVPLIAGRPLLLKALFRAPSVPTTARVQFSWDGVFEGRPELLGLDPRCTPYGQRALYASPVNCFTVYAYIEDPRPGTHTIGLRLTNDSGQQVMPDQTIVDVVVEPEQEMALWVIPVCARPDADTCWSDPVDQVFEQRRPGGPYNASFTESDALRVHLERLLPVTRIEPYIDGSPLHLVRTDDADPEFGNGDGDQDDCYDRDGNPVPYYDGLLRRLLGPTCRTPIHACETDVHKSATLFKLACRMRGIQPLTEASSGLPALTLGLVEGLPAGNGLAAPLPASSATPSVAISGWDPADWENSLHAATHELLHLLGASHPGADRAANSCSGVLESLPQPPDPPWFTPVTPLDLIDASNQPQIGVSIRRQGGRSPWTHYERGIDVFGSAAGGNSKPTKNVMAYCDSPWFLNWVPPEDYERGLAWLRERQALIEAFVGAGGGGGAAALLRGPRTASTGTAPGALPDRALRFSATEFGDVTLQRLLRGPQLAPEVPGGSVEVRVEGDGGTVLFSITVEPAVFAPDPDDGGLVPFAYLDLELPDFPDATAVRVLQGGLEVFTAPVPSGPEPLVTVTDPPAGTPLDGFLTLQWTTDPGPGVTAPPAHRIEYSPDDGATWLFVADGVSGERFDVDLRRLPGADGTGRLRVWAMSEAGTGADVTAPFSVMQKGPSVTIEAPVPPEDGALLALTGAPLTFTARARDAEDAVLDGTALTWSSDRSGALGTGAALTSTLPEGLHEITVQAMDGTLRTGSASLLVDVVAELPPAPDTDGDGLDDDTEAFLGTDPALADTDGDGLSDLEEVTRDFDNVAYDPSRDTDPTNPDTDGDGVPDGIDPAPLDPGVGAPGATTVPIPWVALGILGGILVLTSGGLRGRAVRRPGT